MKYADSYHQGVKVEQLFQKHFKEIFGHPCFPTDPATDIHAHADFSCIGHEDEIITFDVKAVKKIQRKDQDCNENFHWIEIQNVIGKPGWLHGQADYIVFELLNSWLFTKRTELIELVNAIKIDEYVYPPQPYKLYTRKKFGRDDICLLIPTIELKKIGTLKSKPIS